MTEGEFLEEHMVATREHMARGNELIARGNELMARVDEEMRLSREDRAEGRAFLRDLNLRQERITRELVEHIGGQTEILRDLHAEGATRWPRGFRGTALRAFRSTSVRLR